MCHLLEPEASLPSDYPGRASCLTLPSAEADGTMPASSARHVRCRLPSPMHPSNQRARAQSSRCATYLQFHRSKSVKPLEYPRPAAGPCRRPGPTGRCRHRAHGTSAADCRRRFAHRSSQSGCTAADVLLRVVPAPVTTQYHTRSSWAAARSRQPPAANAEADVV